MLLASCDVCDMPSTTGDGIDEDNNIYFTAIPAGNSSPSIFYSDNEGLRITELVKDGILYSAPSENNYVAFMRKNKLTGIDTLMLKNLNTQIEIPVENESSLSSNILFPKLSSNGRYIMFKNGEGMLYIYDRSSSVLNIITSSFKVGSNASFSHDAGYFAYLTENAGVINLIVKQTSDYENNVFKSEFTGYELNDDYGFTINWSDDNEQLIFALTKDSNDVIIQVSPFAKTVKTYDIDIAELGAQTPDLSPDKKKVIFCSKDNKIWLIRTDEKEELFYQITTESGEFAAYPQWMHEGSTIIYSSFGDKNKKFEELNTSDVYLSGVDFSNNNVSLNYKYLISNSAYRAFLR